MTDKDCVVLMAMIKANYPMYHAKTDESTQQMAVKIMLAVLQDLPQKDCEMALLHYMSCANDFPPTPGHIRDIAIELRSDFCDLKNMVPAVEAHNKLLASQQPPCPVAQLIA